MFHVEQFRKGLKKQAGNDYCGEGPLPFKRYKNTDNYFVVEMFFQFF